MDGYISRKIYMFLKGMKKNPEKTPNNFKIKTVENYPHPLPTNNIHCCHKSQDPLSDSYPDNLRKSWHRQNSR